jgi:hypothetical protein
MGENFMHAWRMFCAVFLLSATTARAQVDRATLSGVVKDAAGGVMPGATIVVTNLGTCKSRYDSRFDKFGR